MGKAVGLIGNVKGKVGNVVGYTIKNSNNKVTQGYRIYQPDVANPKTQAQAAQRVKLAAAVQFYRALQEILNHSWEGVRYGGESHQYFMSLVMKATFSGYPYLPKGTNFMVPGSYPISRGSLPTIKATVRTNGGFMMPGTAFITIGNKTLGQLSVDIISQWPGIKDGDQLTFVVVGESQKEADSYPVHFERLILDTKSNILASDLSFQSIVDNQGQVLVPGSTDSNIIRPVAFGVIVSRRSESDPSVWLRSNTDLQLQFAETQLGDFFSDKQKEFAIATYMKTIAITSSRWFLNQAENEIADQNSNINFGNLVVTGNVVIGSETQTYAFYNANNEQHLIVKDLEPVQSADGTLTGYSGQLYTTMVIDGEKTLVNQGTKQIPVSANPIDLEDIKSELIEDGWTIAAARP